MHFGPRRQRQNALLGVAVRAGNHLAHARQALGQGAGLVESHRVETRHGLEVRSALDQNPTSCAIANGGAHRGRRSQPGRAWTGDQKHRESPPRVSCNQQNQSRRQERGRDHLLGESVPDRLNLGTQGLRQLHPFDEFAHHGLTADPGNPDPDCARHQDGSRVHGVTGKAGRRHAFTSDRRFVDGSFAGFDHPIHRNLAAGVRHDGCPPMDRLCRQGYFDAVHPYPDLLIIG